MKSLRNRTNSSRGFTLLEAILALGIFALGVIGLFEALNQISLATLESAETSVVTERLRSALTEASRNPRIQPGTNQTPPDADGISYQTSIEPAQIQIGEGKELQQMFTIRIQAVKTQVNGDTTIVDQADVLRYAPLYSQ